MSQHSTHQQRVINFGIYSKCFQTEYNKSEYIHKTKILSPYNLCDIISKQKHVLSGKCAFSCQNANINSLLQGEFIIFSIPNFCVLFLFGPISGNECQCEISGNNGQI